MDNSAPNHPEAKFERHGNNRWGGLILILIGIIFLLQKIPQTSGLFTSWLFSWPSLLIVIGLFLGIKHRFRNIVWLILILIGAYSLLYNNDIIDLNLRPYLVPIAIIAIGFTVLLNKNRNCQQHPHRFKRGQPVPMPVAEDLTDILEVNTTFGNVEKNVFSKNFKGGKINCTFGGGQINFSQADFQGIVVVDVSIIFGGLDVIIPSNWNLKNEVAVVFGGIEDKRKIMTGSSESSKTLVLKGNIMFGGIEIKSY